MSKTTGIQRLKRLLGGPVLALDGDVGTIKDFCFDDDTWHRAVRQRSEAEWRRRLCRRQLNDA